VNKSSTTTKLLLSAAAVAIVILGAVWGLGSTLATKADVRQIVSTESPYTADQRYLVERLDTNLRALNELRMELSAIKLELSAVRNDIQALIRDVALLHTGPRTEALP